MRERTTHKRSRLLHLVFIVILVWCSGCFGTGNDGKLNQGGDVSSQDGSTQGSDTTTSQSDSVSQTDGTSQNDSLFHDQGPQETTFYPDEENGSDSRITLVLDEVGEDYVTFKIQGSNLENILGVAFHLLYDSNKLQFSDVNSESHLSETSASTVNVLKEIPAGRLVVGTALFRNNYKTTLSGGTFSDQNDILTLRFTILEPGTTRIDFAKGSMRIKTVEDAYVEADWNGGSLTIVTP